MNVRSSCSGRNPLITPRTLRPSLTLQQDAFSDFVLGQLEVQPGIAGWSVRGQPVAPGWPVREAEAAGFVELRAGRCTRTAQHQHPLCRRAIRSNDHSSDLAAGREPDFQRRRVVIHDHGDLARGMVLADRNVMSPPGTPSSTNVPSACVLSVARASSGLDHTSLGSRTPIDASPMPAPELDRTRDPSGCGRAAAA